MSFPPVPSASKGEIRRAGETLASDTTSIGATEHARMLISEWRAAHLMPLDSSVRELMQHLEERNIEAIVAQRLKRLFRIQAKLQEFHTMNVTTMQDIAGLRAIVLSIDDVQKIVSAYRSNTVIANKLHGVTDYNSKPKESGEL